MKHGQISYCAVFCLWVYVIKMAVRVSAKFLIKICVLLHPFTQQGKIIFEVFFYQKSRLIISDYVFKQLISKLMQFLKILLITVLRIYQSWNFKKFWKTEGVLHSCPRVYHPHTIITGPRFALLNPIFEGQKRFLTFPACF